MRPPPSNTMGVVSKLNGVRTDQARRAGDACGQCQGGSLRAALTHDCCLDTRVLALGRKVVGSSAKVEQPSFKGQIMLLQWGCFFLFSLGLRRS